MSATRNFSVPQSASNSMKKTTLSGERKGLDSNELINSHAWGRSSKGNVLTWVLKFHVRVPVVWRSLYSKNKFSGMTETAVTTEAMWLRIYVPSLGFLIWKSSRFSGSYFNKARGENGYWKWPVTRSKKQTEPSLSRVTRRRHGSSRPCQLGKG